MMELLVKNRRKKSKGNTSLTGKFSKGKFSFTGKKSKGKFSLGKEKVEDFPYFPSEGKVGVYRDFP